MRALLLVALLTSAAGAAAAQTPPAELGARYVPAPWWMREPVIASIGRVRTEVPANRANFATQFQVVEATAEKAAAAAAERVRALDAQLKSFGPDKVRVQTGFATRPLYDQYRDKDGNVLENQRADKIERYEVSAHVSIEVRDTAVLEQVYAAVLAARPTSTGQVSFRLEPTNAAKTWLAAEAGKDAARRARQAAEAAGARLGGVKVIDPTGRACQTDVLAGWPSYASGSGRAQDVAYAPSADASADEIMVTASRAQSLAAPPPPPTPRGAMFSLQPPLLELTDSACVVYGLS